MKCMHHHHHHHQTAGNYKQNKTKQKILKAIKIKLFVRLLLFLFVVVVFVLVKITAIQIESTNERKTNKQTNFNNHNRIVNILLYNIKIDFESKFNQI